MALISSVLMLIIASTNSYTVWGQGVVVGNLSSPPLCQAFPNSLALVRQACGFAPTDLFPTLGVPAIAQRDFNSFNVGLNGLHTMYVERWGQACGDVTFRHACRQFVPRCDSTATNVVWNATEADQECQTIQQTCGGNFSQIQADFLCVPGYFYNQSFPITQCRTPETSYLAPSCSSSANIRMPSYYQELFSKADQRFVIANVRTMVMRNVPSTCQQHYLDVACKPGFQCGPPGDQIIRDLRSRDSCEAFERCIAEENITSIRLPGACTDLEYDRNLVTTPPTTPSSTTSTGSTQNLTVFLFLMPIVALFF